MNKVENISDDLKRKFKQLEKSSIDAFIVLVDLSGSTQFKTEHPEREWIPRLRGFLAAVEDVAKPLGLIISKYLGDGVLLFLDARTNTYKKILEFCTKLRKRIEDVNNSEKYILQYMIRYKIVISRGKAYLFSDKDPQGASVDKLFRIEKFIPSSCIGFSNDFLKLIRNKETISLGKFFLKGISPELQEVFILKDQIKESEVTNQIKRLRDIEFIRQIWLGDYYNDKEIVIVSGYISDKERGPDNYTIESGDIGAIIEILIGLGQVVAIRKIEVKSAKTFSGSDYSKNVICVGGPYYNSITREFMRKIKSPFIFDLQAQNIPLINLINGKKYYAQRSKTKRITKDYGFFARYKNPFDKEEQNSIILISGIETYGVLGTARTFLPANNYFIENSEKIIRILKDKGERGFSLLTECDVESNNVRPKCIECDNKHLIINDKKKKIKCLQADPLSED